MLVRAKQAALHMNAIELEQARVRAQRPLFSACFRSAAVTERTEHQPSIPSSVAARRLRVRRGYTPHATGGQQQWCRSI